MWRRKKKQWDGYYYIGVSDEQHKLIKSCKKRTTKKEITPVQGRPMILYKIPEECFRMTHWKYFYRTRFYKKEGRFTEYVDSFPIKELEYYAKRESESKPIEFVD